jgi:hypothetical protein
MAESATERHVLLESMTDAFARGDGPSGETLLAHALDQGIPWDEVTSAAARGMHLRYSLHQRAQSTR